MAEALKGATFRIEPDVWEEFKALCKRQGTNPSEAIRQFVLSQVRRHSND